jgi:PAS domain S-box-containing protein
MQLKTNTCERDNMELIYLKGRSDDLVNNESLYLKAFDEIDGGLIIVDQEEIIKFVNSAACALLGYTKDELIYSPLNNFYQSVPDTSVEALIHYFARQDDQPEKLAYEFKILQVSETKTIPIEERISVLSDVENESEGTLIQFKDLTKIREAEIKSYSSKESYLKFLENRPYLICRLNTQGQFNYFNKKWLDYTGRSIDDEIYRGWISKIHFEDRPAFEELLNLAIAKHGNFKTEFRLLDRNGEYRWLICHLNPFDDITDDYSGYICLCVDITDRKNMELELLEEQKLSEVAKIAKSTFLSNMSHEIRTPLNSIMGLTEVVLDSKLDPEQTKFMNIISQSSHTLLILLNNLLESSRLDENKEELHESIFSLPEVIDAIFNQFQFQAEENKISLSYKIEKNTPCQLSGDFLKLQRILMNLVSNAIKFTEAGFINLHVHPEKISASDNKQHENIRVHFALSDSGIGIPEDKYDMVFESFTQVDSSRTRSYSGAGLGLAIVKRLTELMNGHVWIESKLGTGSCFHVVLDFKTAQINNIIENVKI